MLNIPMWLCKRKASIKENISAGAARFGDGNHGTQDLQRNTTDNMDSVELPQPTPPHFTETDFSTEQPNTDDFDHTLTEEY